MLQPFAVPTREDIQASGIFPDLPSRSWGLSSGRLHDREAAIIRPHGLAGIFPGLGQTAVTPLMQAIANAEGFNVAGAIPQQANNPGDLVLGDVGYGTLGSQNITVFGSVNDGWAALANQINLIASGGSSYYSATEPLAQVGTTWSGSSNGNWANNVASYLGVSVNTPFASLAGGTVATASTPAPSSATTPTDTIAGIPTPWFVGGSAVAVLLVAAALA